MIELFGDRHFFLFFVGFLWTAFAVFQDLKSKEVSNWLNFSLLTIGLGYRTIYSIYQMDYNFIILGFFGVGLFFVLGNLFYYAGVFGGGDAKLLISYGVLLPYSNYREVFVFGLGFIFILFFIGAIYSLIISFFYAYRNKRIFIKSFRNYFNLKLFSLILVIAVILLFISLIYFILLIMSLIVYLVFAYAFSVDKCMISLKKSEELKEGDWILDDIKVGRSLIKKSVHGLSLKDIEILKKHKKSIYIKGGVAFVPVFFISFLIMVFFYGTLFFFLSSFFA